ncbi:NAD-dependent epimerase/dehydratase family protein [Paraburkholderia heleia]|uniref:NAD-dependent epimerase/dehydratase family protein n=1 Tax=Paraburkholderia heleia TaxID=634127 RepID=UPI002AB7D036|nr:NAD-dependent epimerase/dehydratase family protein [Paraburkholderia heleia]
MRSCLIGGAGFIGAYLSDALAASGRDVISVGRRAPALAGAHPRVQYVAVNTDDRDALRNVLCECDEVIDLAYATVPKTSFSDPIFDLQANLPRTVALMDDLAQMPRLKRLLVVSSGGTVYGHADRLPISEYAPIEPISPYGITKLTIERYALMYHRLHGLPVVVVRPGNPYGPGQRPFRGQGFIATAMGNVIKGSEVVVFGERGTVRDYIHVRDVAAGMRAALECGAVGEVYNIGSGIGRSNLDILGLIRPLAEANGLSVEVRHEPERSFDVAANVLNFGSLLSCSGWSPQVSIAAGMKEMWEALVNHV